VVEHSPDVVIVQMVRCAWAAEAAHSVTRDVPLVFDAIDAMGLHFDRAGRSSSRWLAPLLRNEAGRCRRREAWLSGKSRRTVAVSERDLAELSVPVGRGRVIPVAGREAPGRVAAPEKVVLLSGNLGYRPTVEGAQWFAREVWPGVLSRVPDARWILAGARPAPAIRRLSRLDGVEVHADVRDLAPFVSTARVAVAPMKSGSGIPMKVLEAMAAGIPAVVHPWAADGLASSAVSAVAVAEGSERWIATLVGLLGDPGAAKELGERGRREWCGHYHPEVVAQQVRDLVTEAANGEG
jgi:glycosyltransferase involved in cell wall biosynthesis